MTFRSWNLYEALVDTRTSDSENLLVKMSEVWRSFCDCSVIKQAWHRVLYCLLQWRNVYEFSVIKFPTQSKYFVICYSDLKLCDCRMIVHSW